MDNIVTTVASSATTAHNLHSDSLMMSGPLLIVVALIWLFEQKMRAGTDNTCVKILWHTVQQLMPEMIGLIACFALATALIAGGKNLGSPSATSADEQTWQELIREWPVLMTADTLLSLQAMCRLVLFFSAAFRSTKTAASPLAGEPLAFFGLAALSRVTLLALSPRNVYHVDGPLGGMLNVALEVAALPVLYCCTRLQQAQVSWVITGFLVALLAAKTNHFALAEPQESYLDVLFSLAQFLELFAAAAFLVRTFTASNSGQPFTSFAHVLLPLQQAFSMYFLLVAFAPPFEAPPVLVGAGWPFELLRVGSMLQVGMYLFTGSMHVALCSEEKQTDFYIQV